MPKKEIRHEMTALLAMIRSMKGAELLDLVRAELDRPVRDNW